MKDRIAYIRDLIAKDKLKDAFPKTRSLVEEKNNTELKSRFFLIWSRFNNLKSSREKNIMTFEQISVENSKVVADLLNILDVLESDNKYNGSIRESISFRRIGSLSKAEIRSYLELFKSKVLNEANDSEVYFCVGIVYLHIELFDLSIKNFSKAIEIDPEDSDYYYYLALAKIRGRSLRYNLVLPEIKEIESLLNAAIHLNDKEAKYFYLTLFVKYEYYHSNGMKEPIPSIAQLKSFATKATFDKWEIERMINVLKLENHELINFFRK